MGIKIYDKLESGTSEGKLADASHIWDDEQQRFQREINADVAAWMEGDPTVYGIEWDSENPSPACVRIGNRVLHRTLPIQSMMRRCVLRDDGTVAYYLSENDSTKRDTGAAANLDGTDGQVMVEIPAHYRRFEADGTKFRCLLSEHAVSGFHFVPRAYRSAYEAAVDRTVSAAPKLASVVNTSTAFRGGNNTAEWDGTYRSLLGMPATFINLTKFRAYARARGNAGKNGAGWNCDVYEVQKTCWWLYAVEYANFNCQLAYNAELTREGYKQGGLGQGVTTMLNWSGYNGYNPMVPCGVTNSLGNKTGVVNYTYKNSDGTDGQTFSVPSYRGLENLFGHVWSCTDGCKCNIQSDGDGGVSEFYVCDDPAKFQSDDYDGYEMRGELPRASDYVKIMMLGEYGENMPIEIGASTTTYFADYFYTALPSSGEDQIAIFFGGSSYSGGHSGFSCVFAQFSASFAYSYLGSRLCFLPEEAEEQLERRIDEAITSSAVRFDQYQYLTGDQQSQVLENVGIRVAEVSPRIYDSTLQDELADAISNAMFLIVHDTEYGIIIAAKGYENGDNIIFVALLDRSHVYQLNYNTAERKLTRERDTLFDSLMAISDPYAVKFHAPQNLYGEQQQIARDNIAAAAATPSGDPCHCLYEAAGAAWNDATGFWELNGLTDITTEQMRQIYVFGRVNTGSPYSYAFSRSSEGFRPAIGRTNLCPTGDFNVVIDDARYYAYDARPLEILRLCNGEAEATFSMNSNNAYAFYGCRNLRKIINGVKIAANSIIHPSMLQQCYALEAINIKALAADLWIADSPRLSLESLRYLVDNAANTASITVIVHADVYARLTDTENAEWYAVNTDAQARNIAFASV